MVYHLSLDSTSWLATLTGNASLTICTNGNLNELARSPLAEANPCRFKGFLFKVNGALVLFADAETNGFSEAIGPN